MTSSTPLSTTQSITAGSPLLETISVKQAAVHENLDLEVTLSLRQR